MSKWPEIANDYLVDLAKALGIQIETVEKKVLDQYSMTPNQEKIITTNSLTKEMVQYEDIGGALFDSSKFQ